MYKIHFAITIFCVAFAAPALAAPNTAFEDISPTHLQLFQLYSIKEDNKDMLASLCKTDDVTNLKNTKMVCKVNFIHETATKGYSEFIAAHHTGNDSAENYKNSAAFLMDHLPAIKRYDEHGFRIKAPFELPAARDIIQKAIAEEVKAAAVGKVIYWRYENATKNNNISAKSFSAPGILAGFLSDGIGNFLSDNDTSACTFIYTVNAVYSRYYISEKGFNVLYETICKATNSRRDNDRASLKMSVLRDFYNAHAIKSYDDNGDTLTQVGTLDIEQSRILACKINAMNRFNKGALYGVKIDGTYTQSIVKTRCPETLTAIYALFGKGEDFHPKFHEADLNGVYERVDIAKFE